MNNQVMTAVNYDCMESHQTDFRVIQEDVGDTEETSTSEDTFGLEFAVSQWLKLVINAESLFSKLITSQFLSLEEKNQIERWLCLKQECEECVGSDDANSLGGFGARLLERIDELTEEDKTEHSLDVEMPTFDSSILETETDTESDLEAQHPDFVDKLDGYIEKFRHRTDIKINGNKSVMDSEKVSEELAAPDKIWENQRDEKICKNWIYSPIAVHPLMGKNHLAKRRRSIHPGSDIPNIIPAVNQEEFGSLIEESQSPFSEQCKDTQYNDPRSDESEKKEENLAIDDDCSVAFLFHPTTNNTIVPEPYEELKLLSAGNEARQSQMRQVLIDLEGAHKRIEELQSTIQLKEQFIEDMIRNSEMRASAKQRFRRKRSKLEEEYYKTRSQLAQAENALMLTNDSDLSEEKLKHKKEIEKYKNVAIHYEKRLKDIELMKQIAGDSAKKVLELENSLQASKRQMERLKKQLKKEEKHKHILEQELLEDQCKIKELEQKYNLQSSKLNETCSRNEQGESRLKWIQEEEERIVNMRESSQRFQEQLLHQQTILEKREAFLKQKLCHEKCKTKSIMEVSARISHLDHILKEKSIDLEKADLDEKEALRHEIGNLRKTRDCLVEQRCNLDEKFQKEKTLSNEEERKLLECEEAIEAIDAAIEYKNELICGRSGQGLDNSQIQREKGEELLLARLMKLSPMEMRTLLYKYFQKVIDLRESGRKMEVQLAELDLQNESQKWKLRALSNALQQARLEAERHVVVLQKEHQDKLHLMLRHFAEESSASSGAEAGRHLMLDRELNKCRRENKNLKRRLHEMETLLQGSNKVYWRSRSVSPVTIPQQNLKQLQAPGSPPTTKVTRQKNKLIIQQQKSKKTS